MNRTILPSESHLSCKWISSAIEVGERLHDGFGGHHLVALCMRGIWSRGCEAVCSIFVIWRCPIPSILPGSHLGDSAESIEKTLCRVPAYAGWILQTRRVNMRKLSAFWSATTSSSIRSLLVAIPLDISPNPQGLVVRQLTRLPLRLHHRRCPYVAIGKALLASLHLCSFDCGVRAQGL